VWKGSKAVGDELRFAGDLPSPATARYVFANFPLSMVIADPNQPDCPIVYVNRAFTEVTGYSAGMAVGRNCRFLQGELRDQPARARLRDAIGAGESCTVDVVNFRANGERFLNRLMIAPVRDDAGRLFAYVGVQTELSEEDRASGISAADAIGILRETNHRVKNHLSMVASMIRLERGPHDPARTYEVLARRVEALSLLYDEFSTPQIDRGADYDVVSAGGYISRVAATVGALDGRKSIRLNVETEAVYMRSGDAAALGLLASELLSNTLRHAFPDRSEGLVDVRLRALTNGGIRLTIADDGVGLGGSGWPEKGNKGARIVRGLVAQLDGELDVNSGRWGTSITVDMPYALATRRGPDGTREIVDDPSNTGPRTR
jgi:PAS domain S-box-containing protein